MALDFWPGIVAEAFQNRFKPKTLFSETRNNKESVLSTAGCCGLMPSRRVPGLDGRLDETVMWLFVIAWIDRKMFGNHRRATRIEKPEKRSPHKNSLHLFLEEVGGGGGDRSNVAPSLGPFSLCWPGRFIFKI